MNARDCRRLDAPRSPARSRATSRAAFARGGRFVSLLAAVSWGVAALGCSRDEPESKAAAATAEAKPAQTQSAESKAASPAVKDGPPLQLLRLPPGFRIDLYASDVPNARSLALSSKGTVFVGNRAQDKVYALVDADGDHRAETRHVIAEGLNMPNGVAVRDGALYVAEVNRILRFDAIDEHLGDPPQPTVVLDGLPEDKHHGWRYLRFAPDGDLYFAIGAPCNVCEREDERYASILRVKLPGGAPKVFASGVRNSVGFDFHPLTDELWFTDNGRDLLGDDLPPGELNHAPQAGLHFGFPYCHGAGLSDPEHRSDRPCSSYRAPAQLFEAHVAALGVRFYTGAQFPQEYRNDLFVAQHGSWNRSKKIGYRVMRVRTDGQSVLGYEVFAQGWLQPDESVWGRPVDILQMPDGALLVSDDEAGAVYRISYDAKLL